MGQLVYSMLVSLDGYVADENGVFDWALPDEEVLEAVNRSQGQVGTYLYGRRMYEMMAVWETNPEIIGQSPRSTEFAELWQRADKVVYSSTLDSVMTRRTRIERTLDPGAVQALKGSTDSHVTVDGPSLAAQMLRHGLVDRLEPLICPVVVGSGLRFLPDIALDLRLRREQRFANGMVQLAYDVGRPRR